MRFIACLLAASCLAAVPVHAEGAGVNPPTTQAEAKVLDFERVFASPSLNGAVPRGVKLSPDGRWLTGAAGPNGGPGTL